MLTSLEGLKLPLSWDSSSLGMAARGAHLEVGFVSGGWKVSFLFVSIPEIGIRVMAVLAFMLNNPTKIIIASGLGRVDVILHVSAVWRS